MDLVTLSMLGQDQGNIFQLLALQEAAKGQLGGVSNNRLLLMPLAKKFEEKLARRIANMTEGQRAKVMAALVSLALGERSEGEYKEVLTFSGVQGLMTLLSGMPEALDVTDYQMIGEGKTKGEVGGEIREKEIAKERAKKLKISDEKEEKKRSERKIKTV